MNRSIHIIINVKIKLRRQQKEGTTAKAVTVCTSTSFPGLFPFELGRPNSKGKSPGNEVVCTLFMKRNIIPLLKTHNRW